MAEQSKIEWTDATFNPWLGCTKIAPACDNCYAADMANRYGWVEWGNHPRKRTSAALWNEPRKWQKKAAEFFAEHGRRRRVFCASLADVFDNQVPTEWRDDLWALIRECPDLDFLMLTKRPQNIGSMLPAFWADVKDHIWLGTTVEDQKHADYNIKHLAQHDSAVRFISAEPLLGSMNLSELFSWGCGLDWVIAGGESGPHARPSDPAWFTSLRDQCAAAGVPFLFKQWGEWTPGANVAAQRGTVQTAHWWNNEWSFGRENLASEGGHVDDEPDLYRIGKKAAGRRLDGITHDGFPA